MVRAAALMLRPARPLPAPMILLPFPMTLVLVLVLVLVACHAAENSGERFTSATRRNDRAHRGDDDDDEDDASISSSFPSSFSSTSLSLSWSPPFSFLLRLRGTQRSVDTADESANGPSNVAQKSLHSDHPDDGDSEEEDVDNVRAVGEGCCCASIVVARRRRLRRPRRAGAGA